MFQGKQKRQIRIAPEGGGVGAFRDRTVRGDKPVVGPVELLTRGQNQVFLRALNLRVQTAPDGIPETDHATDALGAGGGQVLHEMHLVAFADADAFVDQRVGVGFDVIRRGKGVGERSVIDGGVLWAENIGWEPGDGLGQPLFQRDAVAHERRFRTGIHPALQPHLAEHHFGVGGEVFIHGNGLPGGVGDLGHRLSKPGRKAVHRAGACGA